jgi:hypothetical protein
MTININEAMDLDLDLPETRYQLTFDRAQMLVPKDGKPAKVRHYLKPVNTVDGTEVSEAAIANGRVTYDFYLRPEGTDNSTLLVQLNSYIDFVKRFGVDSDVIKSVGEVEVDTTEDGINYLDLTEVAQLLEGCPVEANVGSWANQEGRKFFNTWNVDPVS